QFFIFLLVFGIGYIGWQVFNLQTDNMGLQSDITQQKAQRITLQAEYDAESRKLNTLRYDPEKTRTALLIHDEFQSRSIDFEPTMRVLNQAIDPEFMMIQNIEIKPFGSAPEIGSYSPDSGNPL